MDDRELIRQVAVLNPSPPGAAIPPGSMPHEDRQVDMLVVPDRERTAPSVGAWWGRSKAVAVVAFVLALGLSVVFVLMPNQPESVAERTAIDPELLASARAGDPNSVAAVWTQAFWRGDVDLVREFTDPFGPPPTATATLGWSEFFAVLADGQQAFRVEGCEHNGIHHMCRAVTVGTHPVFPWTDGRVFKPSVTVSVSGFVEPDIFAMTSSIDFRATYSRALEYDFDRTQELCGASISPWSRILEPGPCAELVVEALGLHRAEDSN